MRNASGKVVYDRRFNTTALLANYYGSNVDFAGRISWDPQVGHVQERSAVLVCVVACCNVTQTRHSLCTMCFGGVGMVPPLVGRT